LPNLWKRRTSWKHEVKLADVAEGPDAEAVAEPLLQSHGQPLQHFLAVARTVRNPTPRLLEDFGGCLRQIPARVIGYEISMCKPSCYRWYQLVVIIDSLATYR
jgi:hypothetical protein